MNHIDELVGWLGDGLAGSDGAEEKALAAARRTLRGAIASERRALQYKRRRRLTALFALVAVAGAAVPAYGVASRWLSGGSEVEGVRGSAAPQLTSPPRAIASGGPTETWTIVAARSDQGLCLNVDLGAAHLDRRQYRLGDCGFTDVRGDLPADVRGNPSAPCIGLTALVPCGDRPEFAVAVRSWGTFVPEARRSIVVGVAASDVAAVQLELTDGLHVRARLASRPLGPDVPLNVFWAELGAGRHLTSCDAGELVEEVVARDSHRNVIGRRVPAWNANPTGDSAGPHRPSGAASCR
jgi:hypothetical protein